VAPEYVVYDGDPVAFILSANVRRRHLSKGQQAMAVVEANSQSLRIQEELSNAANVSMGYIGMAAVVHKYGHPEMCQQVLEGGKLDQAYSHARKLKRKQDDAEKWAVEAVQRREAADKAAKERLESLTLALEEIGPSVPVPPPPSRTKEKLRP
jgi:hypothetical protein